MSKLATHAQITAGGEEQQYTENTAHLVASDNTTTIIRPKGMVRYIKEKEESGKIGQLGGDHFSMK